MKKIFTIILLVIFCVSCMEDPIPQNAETKFKSISVGSFGNLAIDETSILWYWHGKSYVPVKMFSDVKFKVISSGDMTFFAIDETGNLWGWGYNKNGEVGNGTTTRIDSPIQIMEDVKFKSVAIGYDHTVAIDEDGNLWKWGLEINESSYDNAAWHTPQKMNTNLKFEKVFTQYKHCLALDSLGNLWGWGQNYDGRLGDGTAKEQLTPVQIMRGIKIKYVAVGWSHSLVIDESGNLWGWGGSSFHGELGFKGENKYYETNPIQIMEGKKFIGVAAGHAHSLVIDDSGQLWAFGDNANGQLNGISNNGNTDCHYSPFKVHIGIKFKSISSNFSESAGIDENGKLYNW